MKAERAAPEGGAVYATLAVPQIPRILSLVDRDPLSPTYGCFDKDYWHYKTADFPSGMFQECVLPLALVYQHPIPGGEPYHKKERIKELVTAGIKYAARSSHQDGSTDDYYPFERALGASCFSLYGATEAYLDLGLQDQGEIVEFFQRRGRWLLEHQESGRLSNHQALAGCCLENIYAITGDKEYQDAAKERVELTLGWQHEEGWFQEYEGADPGYQTFTINFLAKYYLRSGDESLLDPLRRAIEFSSYFVHPDGSYGGEYGSRNTAVFYPNGYEIMSALEPRAAWIAEAFIKAVKDGKNAIIGDERLFFHFTGNYLEAFLNYNPKGRLCNAAGPMGDFVKHFPGAGLYVRNEGKSYTVISLSKGGVVKHFSNGKHALTDSGITGHLRNGKIAVTHHIDGHEAEVSGDEVSVSGSFSYARATLPTPLKTVLFRIALLTVGRFLPNLVRKILQRVLITGKSKAPVTLKRTFYFGTNLRIEDEIRYTHNGNGNKFTRLYAGVDQTSIYVAMSNQYQESHLSSWTDFSDYLEELNDSGYVKIIREIGDARK